MLLSVVIPCFNEAEHDHARRRGRARLPGARHGNHRRGRRLAATAPANCSRARWPDRSTGSSARKQPRQGRGVARGVRGGAGGFRRRAGRRPRIRPGRLAAPARAVARPGRPTWCSARASSAAGRTACSTSGTTSPTAVLTLLSQHVLQRQPHRHGNVLQNVPPRNAAERSTCGKTASASSRSSRSRWRGCGCRIYEVGISYHGRTYDEGKKIGWRDGFRAVYAILKFGLTVPRRPRGRCKPGRSSRRAMRRTMPAMSSDLPPPVWPRRISCRGRNAGPPADPGNRAFPARTR